MIAPSRPDFTLSLPPRRGFHKGGRAPSCVPEPTPQALAHEGALLKELSREAGRGRSTPAPHPPPPPHLSPPRPCESVTSPLPIRLLRIRDQRAPRPFLANPLQHHPQA